LFQNGNIRLSGETRKPLIFEPKNDSERFGISFAKLFFHWPPTAPSHDFANEDSKMKHYQTLQSEKLFTSNLVSDRKLALRQARKSIGEAFVNCLLAISVGVSMYIAISLMPHWLPAVQTWFHEMTNYRYF
jgi:hypothetical protein